MVAEGGVFPLVVESTAGKTRCACETVPGPLKGHTLIAPTRKGAGAALRATAEHPRSVLRLNEVHVRKADSALTREAVSQILNVPGRGRRVVVVMLRANEEVRVHRAGRGFAGGRVPVGAEGSASGVG